MADRLAKARQQLAQVEELLKEEPDNEVLLSLASECREAVCVAEALANGTADNGPVSSSWTTTTTSSSSKNKQDKGTTTTTSKEIFEGKDFLPGQRCEMKSKECKRWCGAVVLQRLPDYTYRLLRLFDGEEFTVKGSEEIREISPPATLRHDAILPGLKVRAKYSGDGKYYQGVVDKRTEHGCLVRFEGYEDDDPEHIALEHVRLAEVGEASALREIIEIPKHLVVSPDDSEEVKSKKLRQQKALRRQARDEAVTQIHSSKQGHWLSFQATNKRVKGAVSTVGGASQFSTSNNAPDAKIGVIRPVTQ